MRFHAEAGTATLNVGGKQYDVDADGTFECDNPEHTAQLRQLGCKSEEDVAAAAALRVVAAEPPAVPEGMVSEEAVRALIEENEDQKVAITNLSKQVEALRGELTSAASVEDELRTRISELTGQLETATTGLSGATETATEGQSGTDGAESTSDAGAATGEAPPAAAKAKGK